MISVDLKQAQAVRKAVVPKKDSRGSKFKDMFKHVTNHDEETNSYSLGKPMKQVYQLHGEFTTEKTVKQSIGSNPYLQTGQSFGFVETQRINSPNVAMNSIKLDEQRKTSNQPI